MAHSINFVRYTNVPLFSLLEGDCFESYEVVKFDIVELFLLLVFSFTLQALSFILQAARLDSYKDYYG